MAAQPELTVSGSFVGGGVTNVFSTGVQVISGSNAGAVTRLSITSIDTTGAPTTNRLIGMAGNPSAIGAPSVSGLTKPSIYGLNASGQPDVVISLQHPGIYTDGTIEVRKNVEVSGSVEQTVAVPSVGSETEFIKVIGANIAGKAYDDTVFSLLDFSNTLGALFRHTLSFRSFDSTAVNFGTELLLNGKGFNVESIASGSQSTGKIRLIDNYDGTTTGTLDADTVILGKPSGTTNVTSSATFNNDTVISPVDTLPAGIPGQIAFQGGNMHVYISGQWNQVQFVSAPAPQTEYTLTGPQMDSGSACSSETTNTFYTNGDAPNPSVFLYQDSELVTPANDGFYASLEASQWFEVSGSGEITATGACESPPPSSFEYDFGYDASNSGSACSASTSNVYSDVDTLAVGEFLWTGPGLVTKVDNGYYAGAGTWYEVTGGDGEITETGACD
jgi:hypothetical protein